LRTAAERAAALHADGHAATADMRPVRGAQLLRAALRLLAEPPGEAPDTATALLRGRILVSLAYAEAEQGHVDLGWRLLAEAESVLPGRHKALAFTQRALLCIRTGRDGAAIAQYDLALAALREDSEPQDLARALLNRGNLHMSCGRLRLARADLQRSADISGRHGLARILPIATHSLGYLDYLAGDIPAALRTYREVAGQYAAVKPGILPVLALDRARALIAVGLFAEADEELAFAVDQFRRRRLQQDHAEALLARAEAALLAGDEVAAGRWASGARRQFLRRGNRRWAASAALVALRARSLRAGSLPARSLPARSLGSGSAGGRLRLAAEASDLAGTLRDLDLTDDSRQAGYLAVRALLAAGQVEAADREAAGQRAPRRTDRLETHMLWRLSRAEHAQAHGRPGEAFRQLAAGMATLRQRRSQLGSLDLQTGAAVHGREIARAGLGAALRGGSVATVYRWSELSRAQALLLPPAVPPDEPAAAAALEELRQVRDVLRGAELAGRPTAELRRRAAALERSLREHSWSAAGRGDCEPLAALSRVRAELGDAAMVVYMRDGPRLHALVITARRTRLVALADHAGAVETVRRVRADLDAQAGRRMPGRLAQSVAAATRRDAAALAAAVLDPVRPLLGDRDLVVVPTGELVAVPWAVVPGCAGRPVTVAPSATTWLAARRRPGRNPAGDEAGSVVLVSGPGLDGGEAEVRSIAELYPNATVLCGPEATPAATAKSVEGAALAHVAAHGHHQQENPLFSSLDLAGGPLMGYDLHRLQRAPALVVLASCDLGLADVRPGDETVGMTAALLSAGTSTAIAAVARIADENARTLMARFHQALGRGRAPAAALADAGPVDPLSGFVCFGAG
jgi:CHAT domain-containing protein/tetratricopeptide (TPR) repeat protein